jgi:hypothetical protein
MDTVNWAFGSGYDETGAIFNNVSETAETDIRDRLLTTNWPRSCKLWFHSYIDHPFQSSSSGSGNELTERRYEGFF